jgi:hypothetical protein
MMLIDQNQLVRASQFAGKYNLVHKFQELLVGKVYEILSKNQKVLDCFSDDPSLAFGIFEKLPTEFTTEVELQFLQITTGFSDTKILLRKCTAFDAEPRICSTFDRTSLSLIALFMKSQLPLLCNRSSLKPVIVEKLNGITESVTGSNATDEFNIIQSVRRILSIFTKLLHESPSVTWFSNLLSCSFNRRFGISYLFRPDGLFNICLKLDHIPLPFEVS